MFPPFIFCLLQKNLLLFNYSIFEQNVNKNRSQMTGLCKIHRKHVKKIGRNTKASADKGFFQNQFSKAA